MELSEEKVLINLWKEVDIDKYQIYVTIPSTDSTNESEETDEKVVHIGDLEKRKEAYGICGECNEPGTGKEWCQPCNAKRFKENFKNWTSGNKDIDELIQQSQLNAVHRTNCLEWIPFVKFEKVTYIARGGFGKVYLADCDEYIDSWDIENQKWKLYTRQVALKSLDKSSDISTDFLNEIKSHLQIYLDDSIIQCFGITQDSKSKDYMMVLKYCYDGNLRNNLNNPEIYNLKIRHLLLIAKGLLNIHNAGKVHKDFHSGNILFNNKYPYISDFGLCQPANNEAKKEGIYGVLPYIAPEVLRKHQYTKASDIYSFGIVMNEFISEETPHNNIPHDHILQTEICKGQRPTISEETPKLIADLIIKCWDAKAENRPTAKELFQILETWNNEIHEVNSKIHIQVKEYRRIREKKLKSSLNKDKSKNIQSHSQAIYTSRLLSFQVNSDINPSTSVNLVSECLDCQINE